MVWWNTIRKKKPGGASHLHACSSVDAVSQVILHSKVAHRHLLPQRMPGL